MTAFATLTFDRQIAAPPETVWQVWTAPAARAVWAAPTADTAVEVLETDPRRGGREISLCHAPGGETYRCEVTWLDLQPALRSSCAEVVSSEGQTLSTALVTAELAPAPAGTDLRVTVQLASVGQDMQAGYREGFEAGLTGLAQVAERSMVIQRRIRAPRHLVWGAWVNSERLPQWWGPDGFSCRTKRIDLRSGGEWVFDMIAPDGTVFPNHHRYSEISPQDRICYTLHWGENGPKHADAWASFEDTEDGTLVTLGMVFSTAGEYAEARGFGAVELGLQTLGKLARAAGAD